MFHSFPSGGRAVIFGTSGGIGSSLLNAAKASAHFAEVTGFTRADCDICNEASIEAAAQTMEGLPLRLVIIATGFLHGENAMPEKSIKQLDPAFMAKAFQINAIGPALVMKHFLPLMAREGKTIFAAISAKVASISDNQLGGWHSYRASKTALNMYVKNAAIEMARTRPELIVASLHPGTVDTKLSAPFAKAGLVVRPPEVAAIEIIQVIDGLQPGDTGGFFNHKGETLPW